MFKKIKVVYNSMNFKNKIILISYLMVFIIVSLLVMFYFYRYALKMQNDASNVVLQALKQAANNIDNRLQNIENLSNIVFSSEDTVNLLKYDEVIDTQRKQVDELTGIWKFAHNLENNKDVFRVRFFVDSRKAFSKEHINFFEMDQVQNTDWYKEVEEYNGRVVWLENHKVNYLDKGETYVTSCMRMLKDYRNLNKHVALLSIDISDDVFYGILNSIEFKEKRYVYIVDEKDKIIFHDDSTKIGQKDNISHIRLKDGEAIYHFKNGDLAVIKTIPTSGWKIIARMPQKVLSGNNSIFSDSLSITIMILIIFLYMIVMVFFQFTDGVVNRISKLLNAMETHGVDNYEEIVIEDVDKIGLLYYKIDKMIAKSQKLIKDSYEAKTKEREAQLKALQSQINPHFLYNTLDAINWMAKRGQMPETSFMVSTLAKYFRLSLNRGKDIVSLKDEIELSKAYVDIQKMRFKDSFDTEFIVEEECEEYRVPKLILQPIIENALLHGIQKNNGKKGMISVVAMKDGESIMMSVTDNGIGMSLEAIDQLLNSPKESGSYGLYNVNERIKLFSNDTRNKYGLTIRSEVGRYTTVVITVKII